MHHAVAAFSNYISDATDGSEVVYPMLSVSDICINEVSRKYIRKNMIQSSTLFAGDNYFRLT